MTFSLSLGVYFESHILEDIFLLMSKVILSFLENFILFAYFNVWTLEVVISLLI